MILFFGLLRNWFPLWWDPANVLSAAGAEFLVELFLLVALVAWMRIGG